MRHALLLVFIEIYFFTLLLLLYGIYAKGECLWQWKIWKKKSPVL